MRFKSLIKIIGISLPFALLTVVIFLPYLPTTVNQKEIILNVGIDIINDEARPNAPITIEMDNSYQAKVQIISPHQIDFSYEGETTKSTHVNTDSTISRQTIEFELPVVEGEMTIDYLPNNSEIKLISDNPYFTVTYRKPLGKHCINLLKDIASFLVIISIAIFTKEAIVYLTKKIKH